MKLVHTLACIVIAVGLRESSAAQYVQQAPIPATGTVCVSGDGNTALVGGNSVYTRSGGVWTQSSTLSGGIGGALSADGNTAVLYFYYYDDGQSPGFVGPVVNMPVGGEGTSGNASALFYVRNGGVWTSQGTLVCSGSKWVGIQSGSVAVSADGNTALVGGPSDNYGRGAVWVFTRKAGVWTPQGTLQGSGGYTYSQQGYSVALSADGNTALIGGPFDRNGTSSNPFGASWVFTRNGGTWAQQGSKLVGTDGVPGSNTQQGKSVSLSADGNTALIGGPNDSGIGATWVFTRNVGVWTQQGNKLVGTSTNAAPFQGAAVSLSGDGNTALIGGNTGVGGAWIFKRSGAVWTESTKLADSAGSYQPSNVSLSADGNTALVAVAPIVSVFTNTARPFNVSAPATAEAGTSFPVTVFSYNNNDTLDPNYAGRVRFTQNDEMNILPSAFVGSTGGVQIYNVTLFTPGAVKLTATDTVDATLTGISSTISVHTSVVVNPPTLPSITVGPLIYSQTISASGGTGALSLSLSGTLPPGLVFNAPTGIISGSATMAGTFTFTITATDAVGVQGITTYSVIVAAHHLAVASPAAVTAGKSFLVTVSAFDNGNAVFSNYLGQVHLTSSSGTAALPADYTFIASDGGVKTFSVTLKQPGTATVTATDTANVTLTAASRTITVNPGITVSPPTFPSGTLGSVAYNKVVSATGGTGAITLSQSGTLPPGLTFAPATGVLSGVPTTLGTFNFTIAATDALGATGSTDYSITVNKAVATVTLGNLAQAYDGAQKSASATTSPVNLPVVLTYNGSPTPPVYVGFYTVVGTIADATYSGSASGTLAITGSNITTITHTPSATPNPAVMTQPIAFSVSATNSNGDPLTYAWTFGDGAQGSGASVTHAYASTGTYTATVTVTSSAAPVSGSVQVTVNNPTGTTAIVTGPSATPNPATTTQSVSFSVSATNSNGDPLTYVWAFGDGAQDSGASVSHVYSSAGTYTATVTVAGGLAPVSGSVQVTVNNPTSITTIVTGPAATPNPANVNQAVAFSASATNSNSAPLTYAWTFGDGAQGSGASVSHAYTSPTTYTATVTVAGGATPVSASVQITINKAAATVTLGNLTQVYDGTPKSATATTNPSNLTVAFTYDGSPMPPTNVGSYTVVGTIVDATYQGSATAILNIESAASTTTIVTGPSATPNSAVLLQDILFSVSATNSNGDPLTYAWTFGDGAQGSGTSVSHAYSSAGNYTATVTVTGGVAPVSSSVQVTVNAVVNPVSITTIVSGPSATPNPAAVLQPVAFSAAATNSNGDPLTYAWAFGDGLQGSGASVSHTYNSVGTYTALVTVTGGAAPATASVQVIVNNQPLTIAKASIKLNFVKSNNDAITFAGTLAVPAGFNPHGATALVNAGGVMKTLNLTAKGSAVYNYDSVKFGIKTKRGAVPAQLAKYSVDFKKGSFATALAAFGLTNTTVKGAPVLVPFTIILNDNVFQTTLPMSYSGKAGKSGAAK